MRRINFNGDYFSYKLASLSPLIEPTLAAEIQFNRFLHLLEKNFYSANPRPLFSFSQSTRAQLFPLRIVREIERKL